MKLNDFEIGQDFWIDTRDGFVKRRCTDKGTRTIAAIHLDSHTDRLVLPHPSTGAGEVTLILDLIVRGQILSEDGRANVGGEDDEAVVGNR